MVHTRKHLLRRVTVIRADIVTFCIARRGGERVGA